jgi:membrane fusion protein (multidrug efflux system)
MKKNFSKQALPHKLLLNALIGGALIFTASCSEKKDTFQKKTGTNEATRVDIIIAKSGAISNRVEVNGSIIANEFAELRPEVSGLITYLNVPEGNVVQKGTVIARINSADLQAQLNKYKTQLELAQKTEERLSKLLKINGVNQAEHDVAISNVNALNADIAYTQALIDKTVLTAPFTGVIGLRQVSTGAYVTPANIIASIQQLQNPRVDFQIPENYQEYVKKGSQVEVHINGKATTARVIAIEPQVNESTRNFTVRALLTGNSASPGSFAKVYLSAKDTGTNILIPTNAIIPEAKSKKVVKVMNGKASFIEVQTGTRQNNLIEVTSGISEGDSVVVSGVLFTRQDAPVKIVSVKALESLSE